MRLSGIFSGICIFISVIGLYGMAAFNSERRRKEMSLHRVLGASTRQILYLLSRNILSLMMGAAVVASVGSYFAIENWLRGFAYRAETTAMPFLIATGVVAAISLATIVVQSLRVARTNPVEILRYE